MALLDAEGTQNPGENELQQFLKSKNVSTNTSKKLINAGFDSLEMLKSINYSHKDWDDASSACGLNIMEKIKIKSIISPLQNKAPVIVDKEETNAITKMIQKLKAIESGIKLIDNTKQKIEMQISAHTKAINDIFKKLHSLLNKRQIILIKKLNHIANNKINKLKNIKNILNVQHDNAKKKTDECKKKIISPIEIHELDKRKKEILKIGKDISNIKIISSDDPLITNNKINLFLDQTAMIKTIDSFGDVSSGVIPVLISLIDNKDLSVKIKWKLNNLKQNNNNNNNKLKVSWIKTKTNDINIDDLDEKSAKNKEFDLNNNNNNDVKVNVDNKIANYAFIIQYFNGKQWSIKSNIKNISIKKLMDTFDTNYTGSHLQIVGNSIITTGSQESSYLTRVVNKGIHHWRFRIDKYDQGNQMIGIWNTKYPLSNKQTHLWSGASPDQCYSFNFDSRWNGYSYVYCGSSTTKQYGKSIVNGDVIEMILDLNALSISFKINNTDYGKAYDVVAASYRAVVTLYANQTKFTLLSYKRT